MAVLSSVGVVGMRGFSSDFDHIETVVQSGLAFDFFRRYISALGDHMTDSLTSRPMGAQGIEQLLIADEFLLVQELAEANCLETWSASAISVH